jgi:amidophosphoribosyltransferase
VPEVTVLSQGRSIEIFKGVGDPGAVAARLGLAARSGSHAIGHTRMATESAVTVAGSHPFSTGQDTCLVHNGSLSNHNRLRETLKRHGEHFQTDNDTEVAAAYLAWRTREGDNLRQALERSLGDLDGFYTFVVGTRDGFAVLRDPIACKPAVMAETPDWVAFGTEFRALAELPGIDHARIWEPQPATVYAWSQAA